MKTVRAGALWLAACLFVSLACACSPESLSWQALIRFAHVARCASSAGGGGEAIVLSALGNAPLLERANEEEQFSLSSRIASAEAYLVGGYVAEEARAWDLALARYRRGLELTHPWIESTCSDWPARLEREEAPLRDGVITCDAGAVAARTKAALHHCFGARMQALEYLMVLDWALLSARALWVLYDAQMGDSCFSASRIGGALDRLVEEEQEHPELFQSPELCSGCMRGLAHTSRYLAGVAFEPLRIAAMAPAEAGWLQPPRWLEYQGALMRSGNGADNLPVTAATAKDWLAPRAASCSTPMHDLLDRVAEIRLQRWSSGSEDPTDLMPLPLGEILSGVSSVP